MKRIERIGILVLAVALFSLALVGCKKKEAAEARAVDPNAPIKLVVW